MDNIDLALIKQMQTSADHSLAELSRRVGISKTACWNRIQRMEEQGLILGKQVLLSPVSYTHLTLPTIYSV